MILSVHLLPSLWTCSGYLLVHIKLLQNIVPWNINDHSLSWFCGLTTLHTSSRCFVEVRGDRCQLELEPSQGSPGLDFRSGSLSWPAFDSGCGQGALQRLWLELLDVASPCDTDFSWHGSWVVRENLPRGPVEMTKLLGPILGDHTGTWTIFNWSYYQSWFRQRGLLKVYVPGGQVDREDLFSRTCM